MVDEPTLPALSHLFFHELRGAFDEARYRVTITDRLEVTFEGQQDSLCELRVSCTDDEITVTTGGVCQHFDAYHDKFRTLAEGREAAVEGALELIAAFVEQRLIRIESVTYERPVLRVKCAGVWGVGSKGNPSAAHLGRSLETWLASHPELTISAVEVDLADVEYEFGNSLAGAMFPCLGRVETVRLIAGPSNREPLESLCGRYFDVVVANSS